MTRVILEGFADYRGENDVGVYIVKPVVQAHDALAIEHVIEEYCIDASLGDEPDDEEDRDIRRTIQRCFYRARKHSTDSIRYWKCTVEIYPYDDNDPTVYDILEVGGECARFLSPTKDERTS